MVLIIPLSSMRRLDSLKYTSFVALFAILYLVLLVVFLFAENPIINNEAKPFDYQSNFLSLLPVFVFAFTCHQNIFPVFNELKDNRPSRINKVTSLSIGISTVLYLLVGILGYLMFGVKVKGNILEERKSWIFINFFIIIVTAGHQTLVTIANLSLSILFVFSYPLQCHPCRASLDKVITKLIEIRRRNNQAQYEILTNDNADLLLNNHNVSNARQSRWSKYLSVVSFSTTLSTNTYVNIEMSNLRFFTLTSLIISCSLIISLLVENISTVIYCLIFNSIT